MEVRGDQQLLGGPVGQRVSRAGEPDQDSQEGEWMALKLDQFPLLLMVSLSDVETVPG